MHTGHGSGKLSQPPAAATWKDSPEGLLWPEPDLRPLSDAIGAQSDTDRCWVCIGHAVDSRLCELGRSVGKRVPSSPRGVGGRFRTAEELAGKAREGAQLHCGLTVGVERDRLVLLQWEPRRVGVRLPQHEEHALLRRRVGVSALAGVASSSRIDRSRLRNTPLVFEFSLCLCRACLGNVFVFMYTWRKSGVFCTSSTILRMSNVTATGSSKVEPCGSISSSGPFVPVPAFLSAGVT